jgi:hypothetical protein
MKISKFTFLLLMLLLGVLSCDDGNDIDTEKPSISNDFTGSFPVNCDTLYFGEDFTVKILLKDNIELGSYSIDIHNNFDHHSHSTEVTACELWPVKVPVNPFVFIDDFAIPAGSTEFKTSLIISIPTSNGNGEFDEGDYHFFISLTDKEGWSTQKGLSIKIMKRK